MKPEAQRIAIAEFCGWKIVPRLLGQETVYDHYRPDGTWAITGEYKRYDVLPNYLNDLNAMHEAENCLKVEQIGQYEEKLYGVTDYRDSTVGQAAMFWSNHIAYRNLHATATQRAEALLRTIGKWTE